MPSLEQAAAVRTGTLGRAFDSTAASYKFFWFLALLRLLANEDRLKVDRIAAEMIILAWAPGVLYRLSFGAHDRLQNAVRDLEAGGRLRPTASEGRVRSALAAWPGAKTWIDAVSQLVPTRFLGPWLDLDIPSWVRDDRRTRAILRAARATVAEPDGPPYALERGDEGLEVKFGPGWRDWLAQHQLILQAQAELHLARFLQARNPHVPGIIDKVRMPGARKLAPARRAFERLRVASGELFDAYTGKALGSSYAIDHILPRAFVAHDLLWNLVPTSRINNAAKGGQLPAEALLPSLGRIHFRVLRHAPEGAPEIDDYVAVFGLGDHELRGLAEQEFVNRFQQMMRPLLLIAAAQGFRTDWQP